MQKISKAVEAYEKMRFDAGAELLSQVLSQHQQVLEKLSINVAYVRHQLEEFQVLMCHPPLDFDPTITMYKK